MIPEATSAVGITVSLLVVSVNSTIYMLTVMAVRKGFLPSKSPYYQFRMCSPSHLGSRAIIHGVFEQNQWSNEA